ncbi:hypothetical protein [Xanthobacter sediminis]
MTDPHRPVIALELPGVVAASAEMEKPIFEWVAPSDLLIDPRYQRDLSDASRRLIAKIVSGWDWRRYKPPVAVLTEAGMELIDGQHTAIAAASHPGITEIPVMIVDAPPGRPRSGSGAHGARIPDAPGGDGEPRAAGPAGA